MSNLYTTKPGLLTIAARFKNMFECTTRPMIWADRLELAATSCRPGKHDDEWNYEFEDGSVLVKCSYHPDYVLR